MIFLIHHKGKTVKSAVDRDGNAIVLKSKNPVAALFELVNNFPHTLLIWCEASYEKSLGRINLEKIFCDCSIMSSYARSGNLFFPEEIGLVDGSVFLKIKYEVRYPTWLMSSDLGGVDTRWIQPMNANDYLGESLDFILSSIAKRQMVNGLCCYSDPLFLEENVQPLGFNYGRDYAILYRFVAKHYKKVWCYLLALQQVVYQKKIPFSLLGVLFIRKFSSSPNELANSIFPLESQLRTSYFAPPTSFGTSKPVTCNLQSVTIDVLIPTLGRKPYLHQVLKDFADQEVKPDRLIIVEQHSKPNAKTELDFLTTETWPFQIKLICTQRVGACNARNLALAEVNADWVFLADDDIRLPKDFLAKANSFIATTTTEAFTVSCLQEGRSERIQQVVQWSAFGSGCSFVKADAVRGLCFDSAYEGGFGEDADFGMQLRNAGVDVLYNPFLKLSHLKAPSGGFRNPQLKLWELERPLPKPSPTVMAFEIKHAAPFQLLGFKTLLFLKFYRKQSIKNPFSYFRAMQKRWAKSKKWASQLLEEHA